MKDDLNIQSDKYFNNPGKYEDMGNMMGIDFCPVDINGASVPKQKNDPDNLKDAQETIRERFGLEG